MSYHDIHSADLDELLNREGLTIIDMRDAQAQAKGKFEGARAASDALVNQLMMKRRANPPVLVYCYHGNASRDLCKFLAQFGLSEVYNLVGGWSAWENWRQQSPALSAEYKSWLAAHGFDPENLNSRVELGMSPLMKAALQGEHAVVDALLEAGADIKQVNDDEHHALWFACVNGDVQLVKKLIAHGAKLDNRNVNGVTCAIYAASTGKLDILKALVEAGANLRISTHDGVSVLESASTLPVLKYLRPLMKKAS